MARDDVRGGGQLARLAGVDAYPIPHALETDSLAGAGRIGNLRLASLWDRHLAPPMMGSGGSGGPICRRRRATGISAQVIMAAGGGGLHAGLNNSGGCQAAPAWPCG